MGWIWRSAFRAQKAQLEFRQKGAVPARLAVLRFEKQSRLINPRSDRIDLDSDSGLGPAEIRYESAFEHLTRRLFSVALDAHSRGWSCEDVCIA